MDWDERSMSITDCPLCGSRLEKSEIQNGIFRDYVCSACGLKWQACIAPESQVYPQVAQTWMQGLAKD